MIRSLNGKKPIINKDAFISEAAYLVGEIIIEADVSIWPGVVIRADSGKIIIGKGTNIQDNSVLHADDDAFIGEYVTIGHRVISHAKKIGNLSLIGNGSIINDGVILGEKCLVSSGSTLTENKSFQDKALIRGTPGKTIGLIRKRHEQLMFYANSSYIKRIELYKNSGLHME